MEKEVTTIYLEILSPQDFKPKNLNYNDVWVTQVAMADPPHQH
ncbi:MAG: hypothetical protein PVI06_21795 [Desulfobacterales bacterium]|jgi:hypothetical protein